MINYDLPWNPMRLEQRIGRLHRLGQAREVYVYNLVTTGTIEEYLLRLLIEKVRLFDRVIGSSHQIIDYFTKTSFEARVMEALVNAENDGNSVRGLPPWARRSRRNSGGCKRSSLPVLPCLTSWIGLNCIEQRRR